MRTQRFLLAFGAVVLVGVGASQAQAQETAPRSSGVRLALQGRLDALNLFGVRAFDTTGIPDVVVPGSFVPIVTPGVRLVDGRLFVGLGLGFYGGSVSQCRNPACDEEDTWSVSGWSLSPLASFDLLNDTFGALYLLGWLNFADINSISREDVRPGMTTRTDWDGQFWWGLNVGAGVRGILGPGLAIGGEFGWGFATTSYQDPGGEDNSMFVHGLFGIILFEASVGI